MTKTTPARTRRTRPHALRAAGLAVLLSGVVAGCAANAEDGATSFEPQVLKKGQLRVCTDMPYEPFEYEDKGEPKGFDIDLVDKVGQRLSLEPRILDTDFDAIQSGEALNAGKCDIAISAMTITGERARVLDFSSPYFNASQALVVERGSSVESLADLAGQKVAVQGGTTGELYVTDNAPDSADIVPLPDSAAMDEALRKGTVDAAVYDNTVVGDVIANNSRLSVAAEFDTGEQYGMAVKKDGNVDLLRTVNDVLADLRANGGYDKIYEKWFGKTS
ncbi:ABC transporter substrate-binding protein [Nocardioides guangzhouensis]|nr:ABC transporter substrate-binding protein [Nocardioides guangzhouensis]